MSSTYETIRETLQLYRQSHVLFCAHELGVFSHLAKKPHTLSQLCRQTTTSDRGMERLLSALCAMDIVVKQNKKYSLTTDAASGLNPDMDFYLGGLIDHEVHLARRWAQLTSSVLSGQPVEKKRSTKDTHRFIRAMSAVGQKSALEVLENVPFNGHEHILDLGGGPGIYMQHFCEHYPGVQYTLLDMPETIKTARVQLAKHPAKERMRFISGDLFTENIAEKFDIIFISNVIHIFPEEETEIIIKKSAGLLNPGGRLLIKDFFMNEDLTAPLFPALFGLHMLLSTKGGKCYTREELFDLMAVNNLQKGKIYKISKSSEILEGLKS